MLRPELLIQIVSFLRKQQIEYMITGSVVSSLQGEPRLTHDIDIVVQIDATAIPALAKSFPSPRYYFSEASILDALKNKTMFNLIDSLESDKINFWLLTEDEFDQTRFSRKIANSVFGIELNVSTPEDTILAKLRLSKMAGGSEQQFTDALRVYELQFGKLDLNYLESWIQKLELDKFWKRLKKEAQPIL